MFSGQGIVSYGCLISASSGSNWPFLNTVWGRWQNELILDKWVEWMGTGALLFLNEEDQSFELTNKIASVSFAVLERHP